MQPMLGKMKGFSLVELMIVVAIIGILASVAYPSYVDFVAKSNRSEGQRELLRIANLQEQYFIDQRSYTGDMTQLGLNADPFITDGGYFSIDAVVAASGTSYTLTASATTTQALNDASCKKLEVTDTGKKTATSADCWEN